MKLHLELTTQQAVELEMLLQSVEDFGVFDSVEAEYYTPAIAQIHQQVKEWLNARVDAQNAIIAEVKEMDTEELKLVLQTLSEIRDRLNPRKQ